MSSVYKKSYKCKAAILLKFIHFPQTIFFFTRIHLRLLVIPVLPHIITLVRIFTYNFLWATSFLFMSLMNE